MATPQKILRTEKKCTVCKEIKPISKFYKDSMRRDGYYTKCKACHAKVVKNWQKSNVAKFKEINKNWKHAHKKLRADKAREWARGHRNESRARAKKSRERHLETSRNWRMNNKDKLRIYAQSRRARIAGNGGELTQEEWDAILDFYGHKCLCCGRDDVKLTIDHVIPIFHGGKHSADNIQPLCGPCNSRKKDKQIDYRKEKYHAPSRD